MGRKEWRGIRCAPTRCCICAGAEKDGGRGGEQRDDAAQDAPVSGWVRARLRVRPASPFDNVALDQWEKARRAWTAKPPGYKKPHKRPVLSVDVTYEELLMSNKPFVQTISLQEMVDFLVDCWEQEGLYD